MLQIYVLDEILRVFPSRETEPPMFWRCKIRSYCALQRSDEVTITGPIFQRKCKNQSRHVIREEVKSAKYVTFVTKKSCITNFYPAQRGRRRQNTSNDSRSE